MKFYEFDQNNTGGSFVVNDKVSSMVFIEAESAEEANTRAEAIGIYFDGCLDGTDCSCCGDRWYEVDESDAMTLEEVYETLGDWIWRIKFSEFAEQPFWRIHFKDGRIESEDLTKR